MSCSDGQDQPYNIMIIRVSAPALSRLRPAGLRGARRLPGLQAGV